MRRLVSRAKEGTTQEWVSTRGVVSPQRPDLMAARRGIPIIDDVFTPEDAGGLEAQVDHPAYGAFHGSGAHGQMSGVQRRIGHTRTMLLKGSDPMVDRARPTARGALRAGSR